MTAPRVLALDLSLTSTGVALPDGSTETWSPKQRGVERLAWFRLTLRCCIYGDASNYRSRACDLVIIEDYAFSARGAHSHELGELGGVIRLVLHDLGVPWVAVLPNVLKKYACGVGNAPKNELLRRWTRTSSRRPGADQ